MVVHAILSNHSSFAQIKVSAKVANYDVSAKDISAHYLTKMGSHTDYRFDTHLAQIKRLPKT